MNNASGGRKGECRRSRISDECGKKSNIGEYLVVGSSGSVESGQGGRK